MDGRVQSGLRLGVGCVPGSSIPALPISIPLGRPPGFALVFALCSRFLENANVSYNEGGRKNAKLGWGRQQGIPRGTVLETVGSIPFEAHSVDWKLL